MLAAMVPLLDGDRSAEEIIGLLLVDGFDVAEVLGAFDALDRAELLVEAVPPELAPLRPDEVVRLGAQAEALAAFAAPEQLTEGSWPPVGLAAQAALKQARVGIAGVGAAARSLSRTLALAGVGALTLEEPGAEESLDPLSSFCAVEHVAAEAWPEVLRGLDLGVLVYFPDHFAAQSARLLNAACVEHDVPFLPCRVGLYSTELGPLVIPAETACYQCCETRRRAMGSGTDEVLQRTEPRLAFPIGVELLALEVIKFLTGVTEPLLRGHLWTLHLVSGAHELHPVLKVPRCPVCSGLGAAPPRRIWDE